MVGGAGRSGTTLLRVILDSHKRICCGPESTLFLPQPVTRARLKLLSELFDIGYFDLLALYGASHSQAEFIDRFFARYCELAGKERWAEKTPRNVRAIDFVFEHFPEAVFVHVIRDGRDTACSLRTHPSQKVENGKVVPVKTDNPFELCIRRWVNDVRAGLAYSSHPGYVEVRYEDVVARPEASLRTLFAAVQEPWDPSVLEFHTYDTASRELQRIANNPGTTQPLYRAAVGRWHRDMTTTEAELFKRMGGDLLIELGYATGHDWNPLGRGE